MHNCAGLRFDHFHVYAGLALSVCKPPYSPTFAQAVAKLLREVPVSYGVRNDIG
jgi:hypothetical protein